VVAGEVRRLAEWTTSATKEIAGMIASIQEQTTGAVRIMESGREEVDAGLAKAEECGLALEGVVKSAREAGQMVQQIAAATVQQSVALNELTQGVTAISGFTEYASFASE